MSKIASLMKRTIPKPARRILRYLYISALDISDYGERRREMVPPRSSNFVGDGDYKGVGLEFAELFKRYCGLRPGQKVLDVGCGIGRMAVPLTGYLSPAGEYHGFDIVRKAVEWCQNNITTRYRNFHFYHSDIRNEFYNPSGVHAASTYRFAFEDETFDLVFLTSVFTHLFPVDVENYLKEISRVLKRGGQCLITFFIINEDSRRFISQGKSSQNFIHHLPGCFTTRIDNPEAAIAFDQSYIIDLFARFGLSVELPIHYGSWCGRTAFLSYQDIVIAKKA